MLKLVKSLACAGLTGLVAIALQWSPASAADIYDKYGSRNSSPYEDPRYADIYTHPAPPPRYAEPRYVEPRYVEPPRVYVEPRYERPYAYSDEAAPPERDRYGYLRPMRPPQYRSARPECLPQGEIRRALSDEGWVDFRDVELRGDTAMVHARRPNGQLYVLKVDRCSGEIVHARPLDDRPIPYANRERFGGRTY